jgi:antitoxin component of MazEF toxin-antitoxin module
MEKNMKKVFATKVLKDEETGELGILIPEELLKELDLQIGQLLEWKINDDDTVTITKTKIVDTTEQ